MNASAYIHISSLRCTHVEKCISDASIEDVALLDGNFWQTRTLINNSILLNIAVEPSKVRVETWRIQVRKRSSEYTIGLLT